MTQRSVVVLVAVVALLVVACVDAPDADDVGEVPQLDGVFQQHYPDLVDGAHADHQAMHTVVLFDADDVAGYFSADGLARFEAPSAFQQIGFRLDALSVDGLSVRTIDTEADASDWKPVEIYWSEAMMHNGHITFDEPVQRVEVKGAQGLEFAEIEFFDEITVRDEIISAESLIAQPQQPPMAIGDDGELRAVQQAVAPSDMVTSRHQWGAINPDKICNSVVDPYRASIHHTASPDSDGGDPHARMRGMQSYHINTNGWCDIGYHFVVAQSGEIMQGRSRSNRPGAHVGGENWGNVGISMIGNYTSATPPDIQIENVANILQWVHETHGVPLNRDSVRGHREWPGQTTACPGNQGLGQLDEIINRASDGDSPDPDPEPDPSSIYDVELRISVNGLSNFYEQGTSDSVPDAFAGDEFTAELLVTNHSSEPIREVSLGYAFDELALEATDYVIETDHPEYDQSTWVINDANDNPDNPASDSLGTEGTLIMHAFSPNETKRVLIDLKATQYNIGIQPDPGAGIQTWMHHIQDVYGTQSSYGDDPDTNVLGELLRSYQRIDILSPHEWLFQAGHSEDLEGWIGGEYYEELLLNTSHDALAMKADQAGASVLSPEWTNIDADRFDEMVLRVRSHDGNHSKVLYWKRADEEFSDERALRFESAGDSEFHTVVVPVGQHRDWSGSIERLLLVHPEDLSIEEDDSGWYDIDFLYFQERTGGTTSSDHHDMVDQPAVEVEEEGADDPSPPDTDIGGDDDDDDPDTPDPVDHDDDADGDGEVDGDGGDTDGVGVPESEFGLFAANNDPDHITVNEGCSTTGGDHRPSTGWLLMLVALAMVTLRRR